MQDSPLELARYFQSHGLATIPIVEGTKQPAIRWREYQHTPPTDRDLCNWFGEPHRTPGIICGEPSDRAVVLDVDDHRMVDRLLRQMGNPETWIVQTSRGAHIYARTPVTAKSTRIDGADIQAQGRYVLGPGAIHPTGIRYAWLNHPETIVELDSLEILPGLTLQAASCRPSTIPQKAWALITGQGLTGRRDHSRDEFAAICTLVASGWSLDRITALFDKHAPTDSHYRRKAAAQGSKAATQWLESDYHAAVDFINTHSSTEREAARKLRNWAASTVWNGRTSAYDRAVYLAHVSIAERTGRLTYGFSVREIAQLAGISKDASANANKRLSDLKLIKLVKASSASWPAVYQLILPLDLCAEVGHSMTLEEIECLGYAHHDLFRWNGLGKIGALLWAFLQDGQGHSTHEVATRTGRTVRTVRKYLEQMRKSHMVTFEITMGGHEWRGLPNVNLDQIARDLGTAGAGRRQHEQHERERRAHRRELERGRG